MLTLIFASVLALFLCIWWRRYMLKYEDIEKLPGPSILTLLKTFNSVGDEDLFSSLRTLNATYGPIVKFWLKPFKPTLIVADPKIVQYLLTTTFHMDKSFAYDHMKPLLQEGLALSSGERWRKDRKAIKPAFQPKILEEFTAVFAYQGDILIDVLKKHVGDDYVDMSPIIHRYELDVMCGTNCQQTLNLDYLEATSGFFQIYMRKVLSVYKMIDFIFRLTPDYKEHEKVIGVIKRTSQKWTEDCRKEKVRNADGVRLKTIIDLLYDNTTMSEEELRDQIDTFIIAGHHTTSSTLCFALHLLSNRPELQRKVYEDVIGILGKDKNVLITFNDVQEMKYLEAFIKETMRLYTSVPYFDRKIANDTVIEGIKMPKGTCITIAAQSLHNTEKYFPNPEQFNPDRFLPENLDKIQPYTYIPFSSGPRNCIGKHFAMVNMKIALAQIVRNFELLPLQPQHEPKVITEMVIKSSNGILVKLKIRE